MLRHSLCLSTLVALVAFPLSAQRKRDLSTLDACTLLPGSDVAAAAKGKLATAPVGGGVHCGYFLQFPGGATEQYDLYLNEAAVTEELWKVMDAREKGTPVAGLWNAAYVGPKVGGSQLALTALHLGDMAIEIQGPRQEVLIALGKLVVARIK